MNDLFSYIEGFCEETGIPFNCPKCKKTTLFFEKNKFYMHDNAEKLYSEDWFDPEDHCERIYMTLYKCLNPQCGCEVVSSGVGKVERNYDFDPDDGQIIDEYYTVYKPRNFSPTLNFFDIPESVPETVREIVLSAFELVLISPSAAVNRIRTAIEVLLNEFNVDPARSLYDRITVKARAIPAFVNLSDHMDALRLLGNAGSHEDSLIKLSDVEDTFEIMHTLLTELYPPLSKARVAAKVAKIRSVKRPLTRQERRLL